MKQETLKEAIERIFPNHKGLTVIASNKIMLRRNAFIKGVKWLQERSYSNENTEKQHDNMIKALDTENKETLLTSCEYALASSDNFKSKVIELFEKRINICKELIQDNKELNRFGVALTWQECMVENIEMLKQIKEL